MAVLQSPEMQKTVDSYRLEKEQFFIFSESFRKQGEEGPLKDMERVGKRGSLKQMTGVGEKASLKYRHMREFCLK